MVTRETLKDFGASRAAWALTTCDTAAVAGVGLTNHVFAQTASRQQFVRLSGDVRCQDAYFSLLVPHKRVDHGYEFGGAIAVAFAVSIDKAQHDRAEVMLEGVGRSDRHQVLVPEWEPLGRWRALKLGMPCQEAGTEGR